MCKGKSKETDQVLEHAQVSGIWCTSLAMVAHASGRVWRYEVHMRVHACERPISAMATHASERVSFLLLRCLACICWPYNFVDRKHTRITSMYINDLCWCWLSSIPGANLIKQMFQPMLKFLETPGPEPVRVFPHKELKPSIGSNTKTIEPRARLATAVWFLNESWTTSEWVLHHSDVI